MKNKTPGSITELINDYQDNENCYIICTIDGLMYDFGMIPTDSMCIDKDSITFLSNSSGLIQFKAVDWSKLQKIGFDYDYFMDEENGLTMSFSL